MANKKTDRNARKALNEFKYEMSKELGANDFSNNNVSTKKLNKNAKNRMGNMNEF